MITVKSMLEAKKNRTVLSAAPGGTVHSALEVMKSNTVRSVVVLDHDELVGIVSERDCALKVLLAGLSSQDTTLAQIMTREVITVSPEDSIDQCMHLMTSKNIRHLPVCTGRRVIGMVSVGDVVKELIREQAQHIAYLETYIRGHGMPVQ